MLFFNVVCLFILLQMNMIVSLLTRIVNASMGSEVETRNLPPSAERRNEHEPEQLQIQGPAAPVMRSSSATPGQMPDACCALFGRPRERDWA